MGGMMMPMMIGLIGVFMLTGGCDKDKNKKSKEEMINACLHDETGDCQKKAAAWAAANPDQANMAANEFMKKDKDGRFLNGMDSYSIKAQAEKVKAGIEADRNNPASLYYDPDNTNTDGESNLARDTASEEELPVAILPKSIDESAGNAVEAGGGGKPAYGAAIQ